MRTPTVKIISLVLAILMIFGIFSGALAFLAGAATAVSVDSGSVTFTNTGVNTHTISFDFTDATINADVTNLSVTPISNASVNFSGAVKEITQDSTTKSLFHVTLKNVTIPSNGTFFLSFGFNAEYTDASLVKQEAAGTVSGWVSSGSGSGSSAADPDIAQIITADTSVSRTMTAGKVSTGLTIRFNFIDPGISFLEGEFLSNELSMPLDSSFGWSRNTKLRITEKTSGSGSNQISYYEAVLTNASYNGGSSRSLQLTLIGYDFTMNVPIPNKYFRESSETDGAPVSDIVVQSTVVRDANGKKLASVNKDSGQFTVEVVFYDIGLKNESASSIDAAKKHVFITSPAGFKLHNGSSGNLERLNVSAEYPRFRATFEKVESTGAANTLNFRVQYDFEEYEAGIKGEAAATLFQIDAESSGEEDEETAPLKPNIIVEEYGYGSEAIVAGNEFDLNVTFKNTSRDVPVENVVMTIEPANGFLIAAASNTMYFPDMKAGESKPYAVALRALPSLNTTGSNAAVTDYSVTIKFSYQYLSKKEYATGETTTKISIPVEQLDRFSVDEITDFSAYLSAGYEGYVTVPIINKGKSATMNITGTVVSESGAEFTAPPAHYGNLEAGKSGNVNISITINTPGEFLGEVVISYEDENMNQKEIRQPIAIMVEQPFIPQPDITPPDIPQQKEGVPAVSIALCSIGGLMLASPAAMILTKRVKARGDDDLDEDF